MSILDVIKGFDGYDQVAEEREFSRKYSLPYAKSRDSAQQYIDLLHPERLKLKVAEVIERTPQVKTLRLVSPEQYLPPFQAGQYITLFVEIGPVKTSRPYSLNSPPNQTGYYDLTVRRVEGGLVSNWLLDEVKKGDLLESSGPAGNFYFNPLFHDNTSVFVAGGSGITPFMSMIGEITDCGLDRTVHLFYGNRTLEEAVFHVKLADLAARFDNVHYHPVLENPPADWIGASGFITGDLIAQAVGDPGQATFYLCGPQAMYDFCCPEVESLGVPARKIRREVYGAPLDITQYPGWPQEIGPDDTFTVRVAGSAPVQAPAGRPLLASLEQAGLIVPALCRSGECSRCRVKVHRGRVFQPAGSLVRKSDRRFGYVHSCVSYPLEDLEISL